MTIMEMLTKLIKNFNENLQYYKSSNYNESRCRLDYIDNLLKAFGWDVANELNQAPQYRDVRVEDFESNTGRPDYSLTLSGVTKLFVEAKKPFVDISSHLKSVFQARSYGWSANHKLVVLTNFEYLMLYDSTIMPGPEDQVDTALIKKYHYTEYLDKFDEISKYISRESIYSGNFDRILKAVDGQKKQVDDVFLDQINKWRLKLGQHLCNQGVEIDIINDLTQEFINQIIFLRICEDRKLPIYQELIKTIEDESIVKEELNKLFIQADEEYNSGIFENKCLIFDLENDIIIDIIKTLYYPQSPYVFNLIESSLLGNIYEMFLVKHLIIDENDIIQLKTKKPNENRSVVTTPIEVVKYMTKKSLNELLDNKTPSEIKLLRIIDIACGSGVFLVAIFENIVDYCTNWYKNNKIDHLISFGNGNYKLPLVEKKELLENCIYGIDIDVHAVEVAKFSLLLKLIEDETIPSVEGNKPILLNLGTNIVTGNSLVDPEMIDLINGYEDIDDIIPFSWNDINDGKKFNLIIGNPPYVKTEDMINLLSENENKIYKKLYKTSYKQFDKYFLFVERALNKITSDGEIVFIVPNKFSKNKTGVKLRELLTTGNYLKEYIDFGATQVFKNNLIYSSILILKNGHNEKFIYREFDEIENLWTKTDDVVNMIELPKTHISKTPWILVPDIVELDKFSRLYQDSFKLSEVATCSNGIQTSAEKVKFNDVFSAAYWFSISDVIEENEQLVKISKFNNEYYIEKEILKGYFKPTLGTEKGNYTYDYCKTDKRIIFPYDQDANLYSYEVMKTIFPNTLNYLESIYDAIEPKEFGNGGRRSIPLATKDTWYMYGRNQNLKLFTDSDKLIVGVMSGRPMFMRDNNNYVTASGDTAGFAGIREKEGSQYSLEFIQAYLTHPIIDKIFSIMGSDFNGKYYSRGKSIIDVIPVKKIDFTNEIEKNRHDMIGTKTKQIYVINDELETRLSKKINLILKRKKQQLIDEIMGLVDDILN